MPRRGNQKSGRLRPHDRTVDDQTQIIGPDIELVEDHSNDIIVTEQSSMGDKTRREYRNRISRIYTWWMEHYPDYFEHGTRLVPAEEKTDTVKFHHRNDRDIIYSGLNVAMMKAFLSSKKKKKVAADGTVTLSSVSDIKKYDDAIKWGSQRAAQPLPSNYYREMDAFILAYKK